MPHKQSLSVEIIENAPGCHGVSVSMLIIKVKLLRLKPSVR